MPVPVAISFGSFLNSTGLFLLCFLFYHENYGCYHRHSMPNNFWLPCDIFIQMLKGCNEPKIMVCKIKRYRSEQGEVGKKKNKKTNTNYPP